MRVNVLVWMALVVAMVPRTAAADLEQQEKAYGDLAYKHNKSVVDKTCTCDAAGECKRTVSDEEFTAVRDKVLGEFGAVIRKRFPLVVKTAANKSEVDAAFYLRGLEDGGAKRALTAKQFERWSRMFQSCMLPPGAFAKHMEDFQKDHDGSLRGDDGPDDGKLDKPGDIAMFIKTCVDGAKAAPAEVPRVRTLCACVADSLRVSSPAVIKTFGTYGASIIEDKVKACRAWDGKGASPYLKTGMRASTEIETAFDACRKDPKHSAAACNKQVAAGR